MPALTGSTILLAASWPPEVVSGGEREKFEDAVIFLCSSLVEMGARVVYGGNLEPDGLTERLISSVAHRNVDQSVFVHFLDEPSLARAGYDAVKDALAARNSSAIATWGCVGETYGYLSINSGLISLEQHDAPPLLFDHTTFPSASSISDEAAAFSYARTVKTTNVDACVAIGGKTGLLGNMYDQYYGNYPGVAEEVIGVLALNQPVIPLGAYGGCSHAIAIALGLQAAGGQVSTHQPGFAEAMERLEELSAEIPEDVRVELVEVSAKFLDRELMGVIASIINNWGEPKPANVSTYRTP
jgi:hypothetical protein